MNKKSLALVISAVVAASLLAGCKDATTDDTSTSSNSSPADTTDTADETQVIQVPVTIVNNTDIDFYKLYTSGSGKDDWGDNILPSGQVLSFNNKIHVFI